MKREKRTSILEASFLPKGHNRNIKVKIRPTAQRQFAASERNEGGGILSYCSLFHSCVFCPLCWAVVNFGRLISYASTTVRTFLGCTSLRRIFESLQWCSAANHTESYTNTIYMLAKTKGRGLAIFARISGFDVLSTNHSAFHNQIWLQRTLH